jgi:hypothetical protein
MFIQIQTGTAAIIDLNLRRRQFQPETGIAVSSQFHSKTGIAALSSSRVSDRQWSGIRADRRRAISVSSGPASPERPHLSFQTGSGPTATVCQ